MFKNENLEYEYIYIYIFMKYLFKENSLVNWYRYYTYLMGIQFYGNFMIFKIKRCCLMKIDILVKF